MYPQHNFEPVPRKIESLYAGRIRQFTDRGQYKDLNLPKYYDRARVSDSDHIALEVYSVPDLDRPPFKKAIKDAVWEKTKVGASFGPSWSTHWFRITVVVPKKWSEFDEPPIFEFDSSDEGQLYLEDGTPLNGLSAEHNRREWILPQEFLDGAKHTFYIETSCNDIQGNFSPPNENRYFRLNMADLVVPRADARALHIDYWIISDASREFPGDGWQRGRALNICNQIINAFNSENVDESLKVCRKIAREYIGNKVDSPDIYIENADKFISSRSNLVWAIGNCHIDTAWLWPFAETHRKIARSFASQLDLIERYPEYVFAASQVQQFDWLRRDHPELYERVKKAIKKGRFIPIGGSWVECDTNMPSGEALVRQMLLGQAYFKREFGFKTRTFWLPDTFGYAPQLPQICRQSGMDRFLTQKLSWNNINVFPHTTFNWIGLDGSQVLAHMPPANTYTAEAHFGDVRRSLTQHKNLDTTQQSMLLFGHGDGGGGPTAEMIEKLRRCRGVADTVGELPRVHSGPTVDEFYDKIAESTDGGRRLVSWVGELYLEYHRGTYTTQAAIKKGNRVSERLLHDLEYLATHASIHSDSYDYPYDKIQKLWEDTCLCQFHDVLPGSGIRMIYEDSWKIHAKIEKDGRALVAEALEALGYKSSINTSLVNTMQWSYRNPGTCVIAQDKVDTLESKRFIAKVNDGVIESLWDKFEDREVLAGPSNVLKLFEDQPQNFPAWDTEQYATEKFKVLKGSSFIRNNAIITEYHFGKSHATVETTLGDEQLEFDVHADWHENYQFLKAEFAVDIWNDTASYETAFGVQKRPTHYNTSWDAAKFEVCGHRFADLSDWGYGVSILNDSKYGYSIHGNIMRISLLRSPKSPDPTADMGKHHFRYALRPHTGALGPDTVRAAIEFNSLRYYVEPKDFTQQLFSVKGSKNIFVSAVKRAERDRSGKTKTQGVIVRLYESLGGKGRVDLVSPFAVSRAVLVNNLEEELEELDVVSSPDKEVISIALNTFEVKTVRLDFSIA